MKILRKLLPWIPIIGIPLTFKYESKYGDTGLDNIVVLILTAFIQAISIVGGFIFLVS